MTNVTHLPPSDPSREPRAKDRWLTVPNGLCVIRLVGAFVLIPLAVYDRPMAFLICYIVLTSTDWIDGKIARWLNQASKIGPKLDSLSDITMYAALLFGTVWLFGDRLLDESPLIATAVASYGGSWLVSLLKFHRLPSYHTRAAKISWFLTLLGVITLFLDWSIWPLRVAAFFITLTNLEAVLITLTLTSRKENVPSLYHAWRKS